MATTAKQVRKQFLKVLREYSKKFKKDKFSIKKFKKDINGILLVYVTAGKDKEVFLLGEDNALKSIGKRNNLYFYYEIPDYHKKQCLESLIYTKCVDYDEGIGLPKTIKKFLK